jgi:sugar phosphate isomerase/epimerase
VGYHNHWWEFGEVAGRPALEHFAEALHPSVVLELDVYWAAVAGADVTGLAQRLSARIRHLHIKDGPLEIEAPQLPAGSGLVDLRGVLEAVPSATRVLEFDRYEGDAFEGLRQGAGWLRDTEVHRETGAAR